MLAMTTQEHNYAQFREMERVRDEIYWHLGVELGRNPRLSKLDSAVAEGRFAEWILSGGGAWLAEQTEELDLKISTEISRFD